MSGGEGSSGTTVIDNTSPLYMHPSEGSGSIVIDKLTRSNSYRTWSRTMELALASKRKLGFVSGAVEKPEKDKVKREAWDMCNSMVLSWIINNVSETIKKSLMKSNSARQMWNQLKQRYTMSSSARRYHLSRQVYDTKKQGKSITEYFTEMTVIWDELESMEKTKNINQEEEEEVKEVQEEVDMEEVVVGLLEMGTQDSDDEILESSCVKVVSCNHVVAKKQKYWILDSGATHHVTGSWERLQNMEKIREE
ncbi:Retrovirus-related Pol polyprotein from transposon RE1 [Bienertia sinuspersici]